jgi:AcrR family transcriptional regulator
MATQPSPHLSDMAARTSERPRPPLTRERVLRTGVAIADDLGLVALTMRLLAERLRVEPMSLYHHVANKDALLDGMVDLVFAEIALPEPGEAWQPAMRRRAVSARAALRRHPWAVSLMESRRSPGPAMLRHHDTVVGCLRAAGLDARDATHVFSATDSFVYGFAIQEATLPFDSPDEMRDVADDIVGAIDPADYPHLVGLAAELLADFDHGDEFEWGLDALLDGLGRAVHTPRRRRRA